MKILAVGDPHTKSTNTKEIKALKNALIGQIDTHKPDACVILGDLSNDFEKIHVQTFNCIIDFLHGIAEKTDLYYVVGNHDMLSNTTHLTDDHFFNAFKKWAEPSVTVVDKVIEVGQDGKTFVFMPYVFPGRFKEALALTDLSKVSAIFCHQEFKNAKMGPIESKHGDDWPADAPMVISGHIHDYQRLQPNILYVGSPHHTSYGETGEKTVSLLEFHDGGMVETRINLGLPAKMTYHVISGEFEGLDIQNNTIARIIVTGTPEEMNYIRKSSKYKELEEAGHKIITRPTEITVVRKNSKGLGYIELLKDSLSKESETVKEVFEEVAGNAHKA